MYRSIVPGESEAEKEKSEIFTYLQVSFEAGKELSAVNSAAKTFYSSGAKVGPSIHSGIDLGVGLVSAVCPIFGLVYGIADLGFVIFTHKTISEHIEHAIE